MSHSQPTKSAQDIERKAIDSFGILGSFYDGHRDQVLKQHHVNSRMQLLELTQSPCCIIEKGNSNGSLNLLRFIEIQDELRLNLLLNIAKRVGIAAILNYSCRINENTRFLYYSWAIRKEQATLTKEQVQKATDDCRNSHRNATHIISGIYFGIEFVAILQLPYQNNLIRQIDDILLKIRHRLLNSNDNRFVLSHDDEHLLEKLIHMTTYSNISSLTNITKVSDIFHQIDRIKKNCTYCHPLTYSLRPIQWFNLPHLSNNVAFRVLPVELREQIEHYILQLQIPIKYVETSLDQHLSRYSSRPFQTRIYTARQQYSILKDVYIKSIRRLNELMIAVYNGQFDISIISQELNSNLTLKNQIDQLATDIVDLENQIQNNDNSHQQPLNYFEGSEQQLNEEEITDSLTKLDVLPHEYNHTSSSILDTEMLSVENINEIQQVRLSPTIIPEDPVVEKGPLPAAGEIVNILLLGETGIGKSTFINALINYLTFDLLVQAELNKTAGIFPVSLLIPIDDESEELQPLQFDDSNNKDLDHPSHCHTYSFYLPDGCKLCFIDTPNFEDTQSSNDLQMQHILEYINHLTHINAICFLLKPDTSRLQPMFRLCFEFLGITISQKLVFCFLNTRSMFFNPDDVIPLVDSFAMTDIPFNKDNTFYFDNKSFHYLTTQQTDTSLHNANQHEYEINWFTAAKESNRLIDYIRRKLTAYHLQDGWQSKKHAQFQILHLIRPLLETVRNTLRNITLWNIESPNQSIELRSTIIQYPVHLCLSCNPKIIKVGNFGIVGDSPHEIQKLCLTCKCPLNNHTSIEYLLGYKLLNRPSKNQISEMKDQLMILRDASTEFTYFLLHIACCTKENQMLLRLIRMIEQEKNICRRLQPNYLNVQLVKELIQWKQRYEEQMNEMQSNKRHNHSLITIYKWIKKLKEIPLINEQLGGIEKGREIMMKQYKL